MALVLLGTLMIQTGIRAQHGDYRPGLLFREDWKEIPAEIPVTQKHVNNPDLILGLYGPGRDSIKKSHHDTPVDDPYYIWSGLCQGTWAVTLKHRSRDINLSKYARIRWRTKQIGFRELHILLKLAAGTWLVSKQSDPSSGDWRISEFILDDLEWYSLDLATITEMKPVADPDLSGVVEIGFTDLMQGGKSDSCSRLDWIEVYGYLVKRKTG